MLEIKVSIEAKELAEAINHLADAMLTRKETAAPAAESTDTAEAPQKSSRKKATATTAEPQAAPAIVAPAVIASVAPVQQAPAQQAPAAPVQHAQRAPVIQAPVQQAPIMQAPVMPAPQQQVQVMQAPQNVAAIAQPGYYQMYAPQQTPAPTTLVKYTLEQLMRAGADLASMGRRQEVVDLLKAWNLAGLTDLHPDYYPQFAAQLQALGAKI